MKIELSERAAFLVILSVILISGFMAYGLTNLSTTTEFREFLPKDSPALRATEKFETNFGGGATQIILVKAENVLKADVFRAIVELENELETYSELREYIVGVESYVDFLHPDAILLPDQLLENNIRTALHHPMVAGEVGRLLNDDRSAALIMVSTATGLPSEVEARKIEHLVELVRSFDENTENLTLGVTGDQVLRTEILAMMERDNQILIPAAAIFVALVLFSVFRRLSDIGIPILVVALGALWAIGTMAWLGLKFAMIHVALIPLILGLGIDYSIHMLNRYYEERGKGASVKWAVSKATRTTGIAVSLAAATTMIGFGSFMVSGLPLMATFGIFAALGILFTFLFATTLLPAVLVLRDRKGGKIKALVARRGKRIDRALSAVAVGAERHGKPIATLAILVAVLCVFSAHGISTAMSFKTFLPKDTPAMITYDEVVDEFGGQWTIIVLARGEVKTPEGLQAVLDFENSVLKDGDNMITDSSSLARSIAKIVERIYGPLRLAELSQPQIEAIIENENLLDPSQRDKVLSDNLAAIFFQVNAKTDQDLVEATKLIREHIRENVQNSIDLSIDNEPSVGGEAVIISEIIGTVSGSMLRTTLFALLLCLIVLAAVFRSPLLGAIALLPVALTIGWELGTLRVSGYSMDVLTMGISALILGIGIDYAIHIVHRFREEHGRSLELKQAIGTTVMQVGTALLAATITTIGVFGVLALSRMPAMARFGALTALVIFFAFVSALVVLPSALVAVKRKAGPPRKG
jgi:hypothetical protein